MFDLLIQKCTWIHCTFTNIFKIMIVSLFYAPIWGTKNYIGVSKY